MSRAVAFYHIKSLMYSDSIIFCCLLVLNGLVLTSRLPPTLENETLQ